MDTILDSVNSPADLKTLTYSQLTPLAAEIRKLLISTVTQTGGHLASSLGTVELTIALHRIFASPTDKFIWDVGHQSYAHKLLTGRRESFQTLRQLHGISGFPVRSESSHDAFGAGHAGTSVSAALGMALARDINKQNFHVLAIIGDGSLGSGVALEAVNHIGHLGTRVIIILNDNGMSISPSVGAISGLLNQVKFDRRYEYAKSEARKTITSLPMGELAWDFSKKIVRQVEGTVLPNSFWTELGFTYLGPVDGHNIRELESALKRARDFEKGPTILHILTKKGKGCIDAEADATKFHGISPVCTEIEKENGNNGPSYSKIFGQTVLTLMQKNPKVVAITAAMTDGTGLSRVAAQFPDRVFDVGICEQHAVTLAAGMATEGLIPIVAIYSTFLQRAYDQIVHDVCLQNLPVIFAIDRAGIVGEDGKTHQGTFDLSFLRTIPNMILSSPKDADELQHLLYTATLQPGPIAIRYPRGKSEDIPIQETLHAIDISSWELLHSGEELAILATGATVYPAIQAAEKLRREGFDCTVVNARFQKPLDTPMLEQLIQKHRQIVTVEENVLAGGFGDAVLEYLADTATGSVLAHCLALPDEFIPHGAQNLIRAQCNIDSDGIVRFIKSVYPEMEKPVKE